MVIQYIDVAPTARRQLRAHDDERLVCLGDEIRRLRDHVAPRMSFPLPRDAFVDCRRLHWRLDAQRVLKAVVVSRVRRSQVNDHVVAGHAVRARHSDRGPEVVWPRPIRRSIHHAAVTQYDGGVLGDRRVFQLPLETEDRALRRAPNVVVVASRKPTPEDDARRFGEHGDMTAQRASHQLEHRRLARSRPARQHDAPTQMPVVTLTRGGHVYRVEAARPASTLSAAPTVTRTSMPSRTLSVTTQ